MITLELKQEVLVVKTRRELQMLWRWLYSIMSFHTSCFIFIFLVAQFHTRVSCDVVDLNVLNVGDSPAAVHAAVFKPALGWSSSLSLLLSSFPEDLEISEYCSDLLHIFGQRYVSYVNCLVPAARPVKVCQNCFSSYGSLIDIYRNISDEVRCKHGAVVVLWWGRR